jgi:3-hydroxyacyl-[acyl-carrier-protein] dehydratase
MRWMWIDRIIEHDTESPQRRMVAIKNVSLAEEHLHDHFPADANGDALPLMPASLMIEGMAQTAGIMVGAVNDFREKVILAKIQAARFDADVTPGQTLRYEATLQRIDASGASTTGIVKRLDHSQHNPQWETIGQVDLMFSHIDQNMAGLAFPKENFVFSDNFKPLLSSVKAAGAR